MPALPPPAIVIPGTCSKPAQCDSATISLSDDGHALVTFSNGLGFAGERIGGDGPLFLSTAVIVDGKPIRPDRGGCHFYFTDHGTFSPGWERRLTTVECDVKAGTLNGQIKFDATR